MPRMFSRRFYDNVGDSIQLLDPAGNTNQVGIIKVDGSVYLSQGWSDLGGLTGFYRLIFDGWFKMVYLTTGRFLIRVYDNFGDEVWYPRAPPLRSAREDEDDVPILDDEHEYEKPPENYLFLPYGELDYCHTVVKTITYSEIFGIALVVHLFLNLYSCR